MKGPYRLFIASPDAEQWERLFFAAPYFTVLGSERIGEQAVREIGRLCPEAAVVDSVLVGMDGMEALRRLSRMASPPRVLFVLRAEALAMTEAPDVCVQYAYDHPHLLVTEARKAAERPLPALARSGREIRERITEEMLDRLGVSPRLKGRRCMGCAVSALACAPTLADSCSQRLYPYVAAVCASTPQAVERAIRTAVEDTWLRGSLTEIQRLFGLTVDAERGKPTNAEFLTLLAEHVRRETQRRMMGFPG